MTTSDITTTIREHEADVQIATEIREEHQTIVHCSGRYMGAIRIWPTTFLVQEDGARKKMVQAVGIGIYPEWLPVPDFHTFTLIFEGLDRDCKIFDLFEDIPEAGEFHIQDIRRNKTDVYQLQIQ